MIISEDVECNFGDDIKISMAISVMISGFQWGFRDLVDISGFRRKFQVFGHNLGLLAAISVRISGIKVEISVISVIVSEILRNL